VRQQVIWEKKKSTTHGDDPKREAEVLEGVHKKFRNKRKNVIAGKTHEKRKN
jgi:hypothetical protein